MAFRVSNDDDCLEAGALTGAGLLLDGFDLLIQGKNGQPLSPHFEKIAGNTDHGFVSSIVCGLFVTHTFMTSSFSFGKKKSTIWYSLIGSECR